MMLGPALAVIAELAAQAGLPANAAPAAIAPELLFSIGQAAMSCSEDTGAGFAVRGFDAAASLKDEKETKKQVAVRVVRWLAAESVERKRPELLETAAELAARVDYDKGVVRRWEVYRHVMEARPDEAAARADFAVVEKGDGKFPFRLAGRVKFAGWRAELMTRALAEASAGRVDAVEDLEFVAAAMKAAPPVEAKEAIDGLIARKKDGDPVRVRALELAGQGSPGPKVEAAPEAKDEVADRYENLKAAAEESDGALAERALAITDLRERQNLLGIAESALRRDGKTQAAERVAVLLRALLRPEVLAGHPAEALVVARATTRGPARIALIRQALAGADGLLAAERKRYEAALSVAEKIAVYRSASQEPEAVYGYAAEEDFDYAVENALRVNGPQRADILAAVLRRACEQR